MLPRFAQCDSDGLGSADGCWCVGARGAAGCGIVVPMGPHQLIRVGRFLGVAAVAALIFAVAPTAGSAGGQPMARATSLQLGKSIAGVRIGMRPAAVRWLWGRPDSAERFRSTWGSVVRYRYRTRRLAVVFERRAGAWRVALVRTRNPLDRTVEGLGVGSPAAAVHAALKPDEQCGRDRGGRYCLDGSQGSAGVYVFTLFRLSRGRVLSVSLLRPVPVRPEQ
jgi:hypothetical protein